MEIICAVIDTRANAIVGPIQQFKHEAVAARAFNDVISTPGNQVSQWPEDHVLMQLGTIDLDTLEITPAKTELLSGATWKAIKNAAEQETK